MSARKLFDDGVELSSGPRRETESTFQFLNRAEGPIWQHVRDLVEQWYADYPDEAGGLRARFRRDDPHQHVGAWWELYIYTLFDLLGYLVKVHPRLPNSDKRPDFLLMRDSGRVYVECTVLFEDDDNTDGGQAWILDCVNQAKHPDFGVDVEMHLLGNEWPRVLDITQPIEEWLMSLDADAVAADIAAGAESPAFELSARGWVIGLSAWPVPPERRGEAGRRIGAYVPFGGRVMARDDIERIRTRLRKKGSKYGPLDAPFVVALLSRSTFAGKLDMTNAAFGSIGVSHMPGDVGPAQPVRMRNGYWRPPPELRGTRISGVLFGEHHLGLWAPASVLPGLWVNPWAETRLEVSLPFATVTADDSGEILSEDASVKPRDVFGLSPYWPNDLE